jgi:hypothetical protein
MHTLLFALYAILLFTPGSFLVVTVLARLYLWPVARRLFLVIRDRALVTYGSSLDATYELHNHRDSHGVLPVQDMLRSCSRSHRVGGIPGAGLHSSSAAFDSFRDIHLDSGTHWSTGSSRPDVEKIF